MKGFEKWLKSNLLSEDLPMILMLVVLLILIPAPETKQSNDIKTPVNSQLFEKTDGFEEDKEVDKLVEDIKEIYWDIHMKTVVSVGDRAFTSFVLFELQDTCPYYEPDGYSYRNCIYKYVENKKTISTNIQIQRADSYCRLIEKEDLESQVGGDFLLTCMAYKLTMHDPE